MRRVGFGVSSLVLAGAFALPGLALAQEPAPGAPEAPAAPAAEAPATTPAPVEAPAPEPALTAEPAPGAAAEPTAAEAAAAPAEEEAPAIPGWFRIDSDGLGLQLWAGATYPLGGVGLALDMYAVGTIGEFDIGPAITAGDFIITPMVGMAFDWSMKRAVSFIPQLYVVGGPSPIYTELWVQGFMNSPFTEDANNDLYVRFFLDYKLSDHVAIGPQIEPTIALNNKGDGRKTITSMPVGGNIMLSSFGGGGVFWFFLGYETNEDARLAAEDEVDATTGEVTGDGNAVAGRLSFVYNF